MVIGYSILLLVWVGCGPLVVFAVEGHDFGD